MSITLRHPVPGVPRGSRYGPRTPILINGVWTRSTHLGQDFPAAAGTPILAAASGTVGYAGWVSTGGGNWTRIDHAGNWKTHYGHQSRIIVRPGQRVKAGQVIGYVGTTGSSTGNHLHFELSLGTVRRDPWPYIKTSGTKKNSSKKGLTVKHYRRRDRNARSGKKGRTLKPGAGLYLNTRNSVSSQATNTVGGIGPYIHTTHVYGKGTPGDKIKVSLLFSDTRKKPAARSWHFAQEFEVQADGNFKENVTFQRAVARGYAVYVHVTALSSNKGTVTLTMLDSDAYLIK